MKKTLIILLIIEMFLNVKLSQNTVIPLGNVFSKSLNGDSLNYLKVGIFTRTQTFEFRDGETYNSKLINSKKKMYYCILDDSLNIIKKFEISPTIFTEIGKFSDYDSIKESKELYKYMNKDSVLPNRMELYYIGFYRNGIYEEYYSNGEIKCRGRYRQEKEVGVWRYFSENGKLIEKRRQPLDKK